MTITEKLIDYIWDCNYLSETQKNLLETGIKSYCQNLWSELESKNIHKDVEIDGLLREKKELEEKFENDKIRLMDNIITGIINEVFGLKMKDLSANDLLKIDRIIDKVKKI